MAGKSFNCSGTLAPRKSRKDPHQPREVDVRGQATHFSHNQSVRGCAFPHSFRSGIARAQDTEVAVNVADATKAGDDLLADVATFGGADGVGFETCLGWEGIGSDVHSPKRKSTSDTQGFPVG